MTTPKVVSQDEWLAVRKAHLVKEKAFSRARDELSRQRRELPWVKVGKPYVFEGASGRRTLGDLFDGRSQLIVYHFMLGPNWEQGCPSCSLLADHFDGAIVHLRQRDVAFAVVSRAPYDQIAAFQKRMGWRFNWVSSNGSDFNDDFQATLKKDAEGKVYYNYETTTFPAEEAPGLSVFAKDAGGAVHHTYSSYGRGLDLFIGAYNFLDLVPKGRDEAALPYSMSWVRHHDRYEDAASRPSCCA